MFNKNNINKKKINLKNIFMPILITGFYKDAQVNTIVFKKTIEINFELVQNLLLGLSSIVIILSLLLSVAYAILIERKILASIQKRRGPNYVGFLGLLQPIADAIKLILKETIVPVASNRIIFIIAPLLALILSLLN
jgi:NADH:ubiquinone oxidoreductase subunit H